MRLTPCHSKEPEEKCLRLSLDLGFLFQLITETAWVLLWNLELKRTLSLSLSFWFPVFVLWVPFYPLIPNVHSYPKWEEGGGFIDKGEREITKKTEQQEGIPIGSIPAISITWRMMEGTASTEIGWNRFVEASNNMVKERHGASRAHTLKGDQTNTGEWPWSSDGTISINPNCFVWSDSIRGAWWGICCFRFRFISFFFFYLLWIRKAAEKPPKNKMKINKNLFFKWFTNVKEDLSDLSRSPPIYLFLIWHFLLFFLFFFFIYIL